MVILKARKLIKESLKDIFTLIDMDKHTQITESGAYLIFNEMKKEDVSTRNVKFSIFYAINSLGDGLGAYGLLDSIDRRIMQERLKGIDIENKSTRLLKNENTLFIFELIIALNLEFIAS